MKRYMLSLGLIIIIFLKRENRNRQFAIKRRFRLISKGGDKESFSNYNASIIDI